MLDLKWCLRDSILFKTNWNHHCYVKYPSSVISIILWNLKFSSSVVMLVLWVLEMVINCFGLTESFVTHLNLLCLWIKSFKELLISISWIWVFVWIFVSLTCECLAQVDARKGLSDREKNEVRDGFAVPCMAGKQNHVLYKKKKWVLLNVSHLSYSHVNWYFCSVLQIFLELFMPRKICKWNKN